MWIPITSTVSLLFFTAFIFYLLPKHSWQLQIFVFLVWLCGVIFLLKISPPVEDTRIPAQHLSI